MSYYGKLDFNIREYGSLGKPRQKYGSRVNAEEEQAVLNQVRPVTLNYILFINFIRHSQC